jgi:type I restriction enzyme M protein
LDRFDVKFCKPSPSPLDDEWRKSGIEIVRLGELADPVWNPVSPKSNPDKIYVTLFIGYDGVPYRKPWRGRLGKEISYDELMIVNPGQIIVSHINGAHGSTTIIPEDFEETFVSPEYTVLKVKDDKINLTYLWAYLRSPEARARMLSAATGMGRTRVDWDVLKGLLVPLVNRHNQDQIAQHFDTQLSSLRQATTAQRTATAKINSELNLDNEWADRRLRSAKPPR